MTTTQRYLPAFPFSFEPSFAVGEDASNVRGSVAEVRANLASAESLNARNLREFHDTYLDAREENWDGYSAKPVSDETFKRAHRFLEACLSVFPGPSTGATPSGSLSFEWYVAPTKRFIVSIDDGDEIAYAGLFGSASVHGTELFQAEPPQILAQYLSRLFPA